MLDDELIAKLQELESLGDAGMKEKREVLRLNGGFGRVLALAARGLGAKSRKADVKVKSRVPDDFPTQEDKEKAVLYWERKQRPDLVARLEEQAEKFNDHYLASGERAESWPAKWRTWYGNALEFVKPPRDGLGLATVAFEQTNEAGWLQRIRLFYRDTTWAPTWGGRPPAQPYEPVPKGCHCPAGVLKAYVEERHQRQRG